MIFSALIIMVLGLIAFFHYTQGFFSSTASAIAAGIAAFAAWSFHEPLARVADAPLGAYGDGVALAAIFAIVYFALRTVLDSLIPGNVRFPAVADKIGGAVMGLVAGFFATAIIALMGQLLPIGPSIAMYERYPTQDVEFGAPRHIGRSLYKLRDPRKNDVVEMYNVLRVPTIGTTEARDEAAELWVPVDRWFVSLTDGVSGLDGALAGATDRKDVYPGDFDDYADAIYGRRLGRQQAALHAASTIGERRDVTAGDRGALFLLDATGGIPAVSGEDWSDARSAVDDTYTPASGNELLVVRLLFDSDAGENEFVRFGPANARLVVDDRQYFPFATLESAQILAIHNPDDRLLARDGVDLVYEVPAEAFASADKDKLAPPAFVEFKELAVVPLADEVVYPTVTADRRAQIQRKKTVQQRMHAVLRGEDVGRATRARTSEAFDEMRASLPEEAADPAAAAVNATAAEDDDPVVQEDETTSPPAADDTDENEGGGGMLDGLRRRNEERNEFPE